MRTEKRKTGDIGELAVCKFLENRGFKVLQRNYLKPYGEIDIVAQRYEKTHFIEVKTLRRNFELVIHETAYRPEENVHEAKLKRIARTIQIYLLGHEEVGDWQFDVASVYLDENVKKVKIRFLEDIVL